MGRRGEGIRAAQGYVATTKESKDSNERAARPAEQNTAKRNKKKGEPGARQRAHAYKESRSEPRSSDDQSMVSRSVVAYHTPNAEEDSYAPKAMLVGSFGADAAAALAAAAQPF